MRGGDLVKLRALAFQLPLINVIARRAAGGQNEIMAFGRGFLSDIGYFLAPAAAVKAGRLNGAGQRRSQIRTAFKLVLVWCCPEHARSKTQLRHISFPTAGITERFSGNCF